LRLRSSCAHRYRAAVERFQKTLNQPVDYVFEIHAPLPPIVGELEFLMRAISQLADNAVKFSDEKKGSIRVTVGARAGDGEVCIWVKDEGRGFNVDEEKNVWESFYQINRAVNEDQGAGAGLAIVRGIAEMHGGRVDAESKEGVGSTFYIILPAVN